MDFHKLNIKYPRATCDGKRWGLAIPGRNIKEEAKRNDTKNWQRKKMVFNLK